MKKIINIIISVSIVLIMAVSQALVASAVVAPLYMGDTDLNGGVNVIDATMIQKHLVNLENLSKRQLYASDVNADESIDITDATLILKRLVGIIDSFDRKDVYKNTVSIMNFYADYDSGKAMAGTPVTFTTEATGGVTPFSYEFSINGEIVRERSEENEFTYTFEQVGDYEIEAKCYNVFDEYETYNTKYTVVAPYETKNPVISAIHTDRLSICDEDGQMTVIASAIGGTAPYEYSFSLDDGTIVQNYSDNNEFLITGKLSQGDHIVTVEVKDASGYTAKENYTINVTEALI